MNLPGTTHRHPEKVLALITLLALGTGLYILYTADKRPPPLPELPPAVNPFQPALGANTTPAPLDRPSLPGENLFRSTGLTAWINANPPPAPTPSPSLPPVPVPTPLPATPQPTPEPITFRYAGFISRIEGDPCALLSLPVSQQDLLLTLDDLWQGYRVTDITPTLLHLEKDGQTYTLPLDLATPLDIR